MTEGDTEGFTEGDFEGLGDTLGEGDTDGLGEAVAVFATLRVNVVEPLSPVPSVTDTITGNAPSTVGVR
ncbi:hypothetical protein H5392_11145 [Tessaracoccus sp. MC1865]|uniref:hypothetical protein n=1 Tax=Tessaracoccus sp. MC1865 TaxID=2760310 RepID=UPI0016036E1D|nr:hypothetical protein [Tessaracoccus sp. MC1865]MBB1484409.1 hypothetical protein [Tessaracoccus sp. MC1865]QTO38484.1 hypothetical protein J7D54_05185 [Tessaracoccus sp. MC1865]